MMAALLAWQLWDVTPARWCAIAKSGTPEISSACVTVLLKLLELKNSVVLGLMAIVGLSVLSLAAVALGVRLGLVGPAGFSADISPDQVKMSKGTDQ